jgi:transglutaminase/protease-like cytokinesis protein 3
MNTSTDGYQITAQVQYVPVTDESRYVDQKEQEIIAKIITEDMTELQKVKAIHDWLVLNLEYDESLTRFDQYNALRDGTVVCSGYALLSYDLMERAGIRAYVITGRVHQEIHPDTAPEFLGHAWNIVRVDGIWYHYDATWDDPTPDEKGRVIYDFFLVDDAVIAQSRSIEQNDPAMLRPQTNEKYSAK